MHPVEMHTFTIFFGTLILIAFDFAGDGGTINTGEEEEDGGISSSAASGAAAASVATHSPSTHGAGEALFVDALMPGRYR